MAEPERVVRYAPLPHQWQALQSDKWLTALLGGIGAGKTETIAHWMLKKSIESPAPESGRVSPVEWLLCANSYTQLFDATLFNLYRLFGELGVPVDPPKSKLPKSPSGYGPYNLRIWDGSKWVVWRGRSLAKYLLMSGSEVGGAAIDEAFLTEKEAIDVIVARCRDKRARNQLLFCTTKDEPDSWMYELFVENFDPETMLVLEAPTSANPHLPEDYDSHLRSIYDERDYARMVLNKWVVTGSGAIYHAFDRSVNVTAEAEFDPALPMYWTHDFNIGEDKPMSSAIFQVKQGTYAGDRRREMHVFDEIILDTGDTNDAADEFSEREWETLSPYERSETEIHGDAAGKARDTRSKTTDYGILADHGFTTQNVPAANPPLRTRHNAVNALLKSADGDVRLKIHPRCKTLAKGFETVRLKPGAQYLELETRAQHVTTAVGYAVCVLFPQSRDRASGGRLRRHG